MVIQQACELRASFNPHPLQFIHVFGSEQYQFTYFVINIRKLANPEVMCVTFYCRLAKCHIIKIKQII
jgi:hypothetical protein